VIGCGLWRRLLGLSALVSSLAWAQPIGPWQANVMYRAGDKVQIALPNKHQCVYLATDAPMKMGFVNQNLSPVYFSETHSDWNFWRSDDPACNLSHPITNRLLLPAANGPWSVEDNPTMVFQIATEPAAGPVVVAIQPEWQNQEMGLICLGGIVNTGGMPDNGCEGLVKFGASDDKYQRACKTYYPSHWANELDFPIYIMQIIGSFADANGTVIGTPFLINEHERRHRIPTLARYLQLGINDCLFYPGNGGGANIGAYVVGFRLIPSLAEANTGAP